MDICDVILTQHAEQRLLFGYLDELTDEPKALTSVWNRLARDRKTSCRERVFAVV